MFSYTQYAENVQIYNKCVCTMCLDILSERLTVVGVVIALIISYLIFKYTTFLPNE